MLSILPLGFHAREWIAPAVATYLIRELVENDADHPEYLDNLNVYVMPTGNPDGYEYTRAEDGVSEGTGGEVAKEIRGMPIFAFFPNVVKFCLNSGPIFVPFLPLPT